VCIKVEGVITFEVKGSEPIKVPTEATVTGKCFPTKAANAAVASINVAWTNNSFGMAFTKKNQTWTTYNITYSLTLPKNVVKQGCLKPGTNLGGALTGSLKQSYQCPRKDDIVIDGTVTMTTSKLKMQPLPLNSTTHDFLNPIICSANNDDNPTSSIVPIAVGCALAGLIVIVLVAYLIGRRKSGRGYQQV
jgi:hypothetical protein